MNNKIFFLTLALGLFTNCLVAQTADPSAALEIDSTTKGFLPPRMTEAQRDAINNPAEGLVIFNTSTDQLNIYDGANWVDLPKIATQLDFTPTSSLNATNTQAAIEELSNRAIRNKVFDATLNSANQDFNDQTEIYAWAPSIEQSNIVEITNANQRVRFLRKGLYNVNTAIIVTNATAANRALAYVIIEHYDSDNTLIDSYRFTGTYIRRSTATDDQGIGAGNATIIAQENDYIQIKSIRLFSEDSGDDNPANQNQSRLTINQLNL